MQLFTLKNWLKKSCVIPRKKKKKNWTECQGQICCCCVLKKQTQTHPLNVNMVLLNVIFPGVNQFRHYFCLFISWIHTFILACQVNVTHIVRVKIYFLELRQKHLLRVQFLLFSKEIVSNTFVSFIQNCLETVDLWKVMAKSSLF